MMTEQSSLSEDVPVESPNPPNTTGSREQQEERTLPCYFPVWRGKPVYHGNEEALGWALDVIGRAVSFIGAGAFLGTALLRLAKEQAGCEVNPPPGSNKVPDCNNRVYGLRPSSLLTTYTIIVGVLSALLLPLMGAIVDYTSHRLKAGRWLSITFCVLLFPQIFVNENIWFAVAILQIGVSFSGWAQTMVTYAYLPELATNEKRLNEYTTSFTMLSFGSMVVYLALVVGLASYFDMGDVSTARLGMAVAFGVSSSFLYVAWFRLFRPRPAARALPENTTILTAGFKQIFRTSKHIYKHLPALKWFYVSVSFVDSAVNSLATIAITYMTDTLLFSSQENGIAILSMLLGSVPGGYIAGKTSDRWNPIYSSIVAVLILLLNTVVAAIILTGPGQQLQTYILAAVWGIGTGWKWTTDRVLASTLIPIGQDAELMGTYLFSGQVLTWLPPLIFTALNEGGVSQRVGIGSLCIWFFLGMISLFLIGNYDTAVRVAGRGRILDDTATINIDDTLVLGIQEEQPVIAAEATEQNKDQNEL